jgi:hypothetical protein
MVLCLDSSVETEQKVSVVFCGGFKRRIVVVVERAIICVNVLVIKLICKKYRVHKESLQTRKER